MADENQKKILLALGLFSASFLGAYLGNKQAKPQHQIHAQQSSHLFERKRKDSLVEENKTEQEQEQQDVSLQYVITGDIGGTNTRLRLCQLDLYDKEGTEIKKEEKYSTQKSSSFTECLKKFLENIDEAHKPSIAVVGIAGSVQNNVVLTTNAMHWGKSDGDKIAQECGLESLTFINDFEAVGYGATNVKESDLVQIQEGVYQKDAPKVVIGPGTGLGVGYLTKSKYSRFYEVSASEGGHVDFPQLGEEDYELYKFAMNFIETSDNVENLRAKGKIDRLSIERVCAGPAVPMLYQFLKERNPQIKTCFDEGKSAKPFDDLESKDIIINGMKENPDEICRKVVDLFTKIFAVSAGNHALTFKPHGGMYLVGGVTTGIQDYITSTSTFVDNFNSKGRLSEVAKNTPIFIVRDEACIGLLGAEECAFRILFEKYSLVLKE